MPSLLLGLVAFAWAATLLTPDDVVRAALAHDPAYLSATADVDTARAELRAATFLRQNPTISTEASLTSDRLSVAVEQPISLTGEGIAAHAAARGRVAIRELEAHRAALETAAEARLTLADAIVAEARARIYGEALAAATAHRVAIEARVAAGDRAPLDGQLARLEEGRCAEAFLTARREALDARIALARFVEGADVAELPGDPLIVAGADSTPRILASVETDAKTGSTPENPGSRSADRSDLRAAELRVSVARAEGRAARAATLPAVTVGAFVEREDGALAVGPSLGLTLPLWHGNGAAIAGTDATERVATAEASRLAERVRVEQIGTVGHRDAADALLAGLPVPAADDARAALAALAEAQVRGELDTTTASLLRAEVLDGWAAALDLRRAVAEARVLALLAAEDAALLPPEHREVSR